MSLLGQAGRDYSRERFGAATAAEARAKIHLEGTKNTRKSEGKTNERGVPRKDLHVIPAQPEAGASAAGFPASQQPAPDLIRGRPAMAMAIARFPRNTMPGDLLFLRDPWCSSLSS
jgi:hypothetical protein